MDSWLASNVALGALFGNRLYFMGGNYSITTPVGQEMQPSEIPLPTPVSAHSLYNRNITLLGRA